MPEDLRVRLIRELEKQREAAERCLSESRDSMGRVRKPNMAATGYGMRHVVESIENLLEE